MVSVASAAMERRSQPEEKDHHTPSALRRHICQLTGDMHVYREWMKRQVLLVQLVDWVLRGVAQVVFVNNPLSGLLIAAGLLLQNRWWALNGLLGTLLSTASALLIGQNREAISAGLHGYNGTLVGMLMAVYSARGDWYWGLLLPNAFMSMLCPVLTSALASVLGKWDLPVLTLPFNILLYLHMAATGGQHPYYPQVVIQPKLFLQHNSTLSELSVIQLALSVPVGVGQVYGCAGPWTGAVVILGLLLSSPALCLHAVLGSAAGTLAGLALAVPPPDIYAGLWGYNSALSCIAIGGMFYALTWQTHLLAVTCAFFCAYMCSAVSNVVSLFGLPACTWPFCLSALLFLLLSSKVSAIYRLPLSAVSYPEENRRFYRARRGAEGPRETRQDDKQTTNRHTGERERLPEEEQEDRRSSILIA